MLYCDDTNFMLKSLRPQVSFSKMRRGKGKGNDVCIRSHLLFQFRGACLPFLDSSVGFSSCKLKGRKKHAKTNAATLKQSEMMQRMRITLPYAWTALRYWSSGRLKTYVMSTKALVASNSPGTLAASSAGKRLFQTDPEIADPTL